MQRVQFLLRGIGLGLALGLAACSGGSDAADPQAPTISFSFIGSQGDASEGGAALDIAVRLNLTGSLSGAVSVDVADLTTGTATSGTDYSTFSTQTLLFPASSVNGAVQMVGVTASADNRAEGATETVNLSLENPVGGSLQGTPAYQVQLLDGQEASLVFLTASQVTPDESNTSYTATVQLNLTAGATLGFDASANLLDLGSGQATSGSDYTVYASSTITFGAGSNDGDQQMTTVQVMDDMVAENLEALMLALQDNGSGAVIGAQTTHLITITDDDGTPSSFLHGSEGATGLESNLVYDSNIDLGVQTVGAGPNAGTLIRITNQGGGPMSLGTPTVGGAHPQDFRVEIEAFQMQGPAAGPEGFPVEVDALMPVVEAQADSLPGLQVVVLESQLEQLEGVAFARLHDFPLPGYGNVTLDVDRQALPVAPNAQLVVDGIVLDGGLASALADLSIWRGSVLEIPGSEVFLSMSSTGLNGYVDLPFAQGGLIHLMGEASTEGGPTLCRVVHDEDLMAAGNGAPLDLCGGELLVPGAPPRTDSMLTGGGSENLTVANCRLAIETDYQLFQKLGSSSAVTNYVTGLIAAVSAQYFIDVQVTLSIEYLGIYTNSADPWTSQDSGGDTLDLLNEFRAAWTGGGWPVAADLAHFISGANLGGGIAYVDVLCNQSYGFGVSANINGNINWGTWSGTPSSFTWDFVVVAHELGHNFGTGHTHSYCPPLDVCYTNCNGSTSCSQGTIMSYCHTCGGMDNIDLRFHQVVANTMRQSVQASCLGESTLSQNGYVQYLVRFNPLGGLGARSASMQFVHDAPNATNPFRLVLRGDAQ